MLTLKGILFAMFSGVLIFLAGCLYAGFSSNQLDSISQWFDARLEDKSQN